jgi:myo-inositol 2-dehydrogenase / D-chiro-inositol 1-dehydrogenase
VASTKAPTRQPQLIVLETDRRAVVYIELYLDAGYGYDVRAEVVCEDGTVSLSPTPPISIRQKGLEGFEVESDWRRRFAEAYANQMRGWVNSIRSGKSVGSSAWDGYVASKTAEACLTALRTGMRAQIDVEQAPTLYR